jgi:hypothetical protein
MATIDEVFHRIRAAFRSRLEVIDRQLPRGIRFRYAAEFTAIASSFTHRIA